METFRFRFGRTSVLW